MSTQNEWRPIADNPSDSDYPIIVGTWKDGEWITHEATSFKYVMATQSAFWITKPKTPPPPKRELTQRERDLEASKEAYDLWFNGPPSSREHLIEIICDQRTAARREFAEKLNKLWMIVPADQIFSAITSEINKELREYKKQ